MDMACLCEQIAGKNIELSEVCLGHLWLFQDLPSDDIAALNQKALRKKLVKGSILFSQGDKADEMFLIKGGRMKLSKILEDGSELTLDIRKTGDFVSCGATRTRLWASAGRGRSQKAMAR